DGACLRPAATSSARRRSKPLCGAWMTSMEPLADLLAAENRAVLELLRAIDRRPRARVGELESAALAEEGDGVVPDNLLNRGVVDALRAHDVDRLGNLQRVAD